jgi:hypothetical protein
MWQPGGSGGRHEARGEVSATSQGTAIATGTTWTNLGAATSFAYEAITLCLRSFDTGGVDNIVDLGVSDGTNRYEIVTDLEFAAAKDAEEHTLQVYIPVHVAAGAQLSCRKGSTGAGSIHASLIGHSDGLGGAPGFSRCIALFTPASSRGIAIDPGGTVDTKGAWAELTASSPEDIGAMFGLIGYNGDVARAAAAGMLLDIGIGAASAEFVLYPNAALRWASVFDGPTNCPRIPVFACDVPKTTRIVGRAQCGVATAGDRTVDLALYGLVK